MLEGRNFHIHFTNCITWNKLGTQHRADEWMGWVFLTLTSLLRLPLVVSLHTWLVVHPPAHVPWSETHQDPCLTLLFGLASVSFRPLFCLLFPRLSSDITSHEEIIMRWLSLWDLLNFDFTITYRVLRNMEKLSRSTASHHLGVINYSDCTLEAWAHRDTPVDTRHANTCTHMHRQILTQRYAKDYWKFRNMLRIIFYVYVRQALFSFQEMNVANILFVHVKRTPFNNIFVLKAEFS